MLYRSLQGPNVLIFQISEWRASVSTLVIGTSVRALRRTLHNAYPNKGKTPSHLDQIGYRHLSRCSVDICQPLSSRTLRTVERQRAEKHQSIDIQWTVSFSAFLYSYFRLGRLVARRALTVTIKGGCPSTSAASSQVVGGSEKPASVTCDRDHNATICRSTRLSAKYRWYPAFLAA